MMRLLIVALNPSVDVEWRVSRVQWEEKNVLESERRWPGGKGINVARWLKHLGRQPRLLLPLGGKTGREMKSGLRAEGISTRIIPLGEPTRANVIITTPTQGQLRFNPAGPRLSTAQWRLIQTAVKRELSSAHLLILSGSLPRGLPANAYQQLMLLAGHAGVRVLLDCDGAPFVEAVRARPFLVKPNEHELEQFCGRRIRDETSARAASLELSDRTGGWVLLSRGARGAILVNAGSGKVLSARAPLGPARNTVGAGDALLAAVAAQVAAEAAPEQWLVHGIAAGTALTRCEAGVLPSRAALRRIAREISTR